MKRQTKSNKYEYDYKTVYVDTNTHKKLKMKSVLDGRTIGEIIKIYVDKDK